MLLKGAINLSDAELISILLGSGSPGQSALQLARQILASANSNLRELTRLSFSDLQQFNGVGVAKSVSLLAAFELGRRRELSGALERKSIHGSKDAYSVLRPVLEDLSHEEFWVVFLNNRNQILSQRRISKGGLSGTTADPREVFAIALELKATGLIMAHNHPSGGLIPSSADNNLTKNMSQAGNILLIRVLDHVIISSEGYFSYSDEGLL